MVQLVYSLKNMGECKNLLFSKKIFVADKEAGSYVPLTCERRRDIQEV